VAAAKPCARGSVPAVIAGKHQCLKVGQRCKKRLDRQYHRYGFHCHSGRLTSRGSVPPPALPAAGTVVGSFPVPALSSIAVTEDAVWVGPEDAAARSAITRIDPQTNAVAATVPIAATTGAHQEDTGIFLTGGAGAVWVSDRLNSVVVRIDARTNAVTARIPVAPKPRGAVVADGFLWVTNHDSDLVSKIDPATNQVVATIETHSPPTGSEQPRTIAAGAGAIWVGQRYSDDRAVVRIDPATNRVVASVRARCAASGIDVMAVESDALWFSAADGCESGIVRVDPRTNAVVGRLVPDQAVAALELAFGSLWAALDNPARLIQVDRATGKVVASLSLPDNGTIWAIEQGFGALWVRQEGRLVRIAPRAAQPRD
jgi:YVTN family beta-propeller protein